MKKEVCANHQVYQPWNKRGKCKGRGIAWHEVDLAK
jgi:hypothetical protein